MGWNLETLIVTYGARRSTKCDDSKNVEQRGVGVDDEYRYGFAVHIELSSCHIEPRNSRRTELQSCSRNPAYSSTAYPDSNITIEIICDTCARPSRRIRAARSTHHRNSESRRWPPWITEVAYLHAHYAKPGCYAARIEHA